MSIINRIAQLKGKKAELPMWRGLQPGKQPPTDTAEQVMPSPGMPPARIQGPSALPNRDNPLPDLSNLGTEASARAMSTLSAQADKAPARGILPQAGEGKGLSGSGETLVAGAPPAPAPAAKDAPPPAAEAKGSTTDNIMDLFKQDEVTDEHLHKLAMSLKEVDIGSLSQECKEMSALVSQRRQGVNRA